MEKLINDIYQKIKSHCAIKNLSVNIVDNQVILTGQTVSFYQKQKAQVVVGKLPTGLQLENEIEVASQTTKVG